MLHQRKLARGVALAAGSCVVPSRLVFLRRGSSSSASSGLRMHACVWIIAVLTSTIRRRHALLIELGAYAAENSKTSGRWG
jgi:hypothetical protein